MDSPSPRLFKFRVFSSSSSFEFEFGELGGADLAFEFELAALAELELELFSRLRPCYHRGRRRRSGDGGRRRDAPSPPSRCHCRHGTITRLHHFTAAVTAALERTRRNAPAELVHDVGRNATVLVVVDAAVTAVVVPVDRRLTRLEIKGVLGGCGVERPPKRECLCPRLVSEAHVVDAWLELRLRRATVLTQVVTRP